MREVSIVLVDDHQVVIDGLEAFLHPHFTVVGKAKNGKEAIQMVKILKPDVLMMDIDMPVMNGMVAAKEIRTLLPEVKIIILSLHAEKSIIRHLIQIGVMGYLIKSSSKEEVIRAVEMVVGGKPYFSTDVTMALSSQDTPMDAKISPKNANLLSQLTTREIEILKAVGEGLSSKEIAKAMHISDRTVDTHRNNIMKKLEVNKVVGLIKFAIKCGLVE